MPAPEDTIAAYFQAIRRRDADAWVACFAPEGVAHDPAHAPSRQGSEAHRAFFAEVTGLFTELDFREEAPRVCGNLASVAFTARCVSLAGRTATASGIDVFRFDADGRILVLEGFWDPSPLFALAG